MNYIISGYNPAGYGTPDGYDRNIAYASSVVMLSEACRRSHAGLSEVGCKACLGCFLIPVRGSVTYSIRLYMHDFTDPASYIVTPAAL